MRRGPWRHDNGHKFIHIESDAAAAAAAAKNWQGFKVESQATGLFSAAILRAV
jgi:hypothetical protein